MDSFQIVKLSATYRDWAVELIEKYWTSNEVISRGKIYDANLLPGLIAMEDNEPVGLITYHIVDNECEIVTLNTLIEGYGVGAQLIARVENVARAAGCKRLWLITTNDNFPAIGYYQRRGFLMVAVHRYAIDEARKLKPELPLYGIDSIPIRDEVEFEMLL